LRCQVPHMNNNDNDFRYQDASFLRNKFVFLLHLASTDICTESKLTIHLHIILVLNCESN
jgi:hypothetical protein